MMKKTITENFVYNGVNTLFTSVIMLALSIIIARHLGPADYGSYSLIVWVFSMVNIIGLMGFPNAVEKYVSEYDGRNEQDTIKKIISFVLKIEILWGVFVAVLLMALANKLSLWLRHPEFKTLFWVVALTIIPSALSSIFVSVTRGLQIFKNIMIVNIIVLSLLMGFILLVLSKGAGVLGILWGQLGATLINVFIFWFLLRNLLSLPLLGRLSLAGPLKKKILSFNAALLGVMILDLIIWQKSEVFFLTMFRTPEEVGYYGLAFGVSAMSVKFIPESFGRVIGPVLSNRYGAQDRAGFNQVFTKSTKYLMLMTAPFCIAIATMAKPLIELVYGKSFLPSAGILPILVISSALGVIGYSAAGVIYGREKQNILLVILSFVAAFNLTMDVLLIPRYGIYGAAVANSVAQGVCIFLAFSWVHVKMKFRFPLGSFAKTFFAGVVAAGTMYFSLSICGKSLLNLILLLIMGEGVYVLIICLTQKEEIKGLKRYLPDLRGWNFLPLKIARKLKHWRKRKVNIVDTNTREYYNSVYRKGSPKLKLFEEWGYEIYNKIIEYLITNQITSGKLIDLGCGSGLFLRLLKDKNTKFNLTAVDFSEEALKIVKKRGIEDLVIIKCDLDNLTGQFKENTFDIATSLGTHEHIYDYLDSFRQIYSILKAGGLFILALPSGQQLNNDWYNDGLQTSWRNTEEKWISDVESCGFKLCSKDFAGGHWILILKR